MNHRRAAYAGMAAALALLESKSHWERSKRLGIERYGTPVQAGNGRKALVDAYQEALDLAVYLRQEIEERKP